jgi:hypothetical protein
MRIFYRAGRVRMVSFAASGRYYITAIQHTRFTEYQRAHAAPVGTLTRQPWQLTFASRRKRKRFLRKIGATIDWVHMWWWYIGRNGHAR